MAAHVTLRPGHSPHPPHPPGLCLWVPNRRGGLAKPGTTGPRAFLGRAGCLSLGNPADWPKCAGRNSHWGTTVHRAPQRLRACPPTGAFMSLRSGPDLGEERTAPGLPQQGSRVPTLPPQEGSCPPTCCPTLARTCPCLQRQRNPHAPVHPGRLCAQCPCGLALGPAGASTPPGPGQPRGTKSPRRGTPGWERQPVSHSPSSPTLPALPAHKGRRPARRPGAQLPGVPRRRSRPRPLPHPQPTGVPGAQKPCEQQPGGVASSSVRPPWGCINAWSPAEEKVDTVSTRASQGGRSGSRPEPGSRLRQGRASGQLGRRQQPQCLQPGWWQEGGRCGAPPHPHRKQGAPRAASGGEWGDRRAALGGRAGWQEAWARPF